MLNTFQGFFILIASTAGSLLFMWALNHFWPRESRKEHNDQIGWQLTALGTTYAVILGFMLFAVWSEFQSADLNADLEADALVNVYRVAEGLPEPQRTQLQNLARNYAEVVINAEWNEMASGKVPNGSRDVDRQMWATVMSIKSASPAELNAADHALTQLGSLTQFNRTRIMQSTDRLPAVLWSVLIVGGILSVASSCLFGSANEVLHSLQVFAFSLLIALGLVAIAAINRPFQGTVHVHTFGFVRALQNMQLH
ncbi:MAG TPA: hypothetical protein VK976_12000 [Verrucomicrobiae bacterium]|jgi:hypothetical protein|nr:hypothetical protein [Verrucomicrobiae bacterium]